MESMTFDIAIKLYDKSVLYEVNAKDPEIYLITNAEYLITNAEVNGSELDAARIKVHDFVAEFLDGSAAAHVAEFLDGSAAAHVMGRKFNGTDMQSRSGQFKTESSDDYWADTIIVYVNTVVKRDEIEELVIALAEEFAGKEASVEV